MPLSHLKEMKNKDFCYLHESMKFTKNIEIAEVSHFLNFDAARDFTKILREMIGEAIIAVQVLPPERKKNAN